MTPRPLITIDLQSIVRSRLGRGSRFVPTALVRWLERVVRQDELNALLRSNYPREGADFCRGVLSDLDVKVDVVDSDLLPPPSQRRVMIVCNHPLGGLDGMALIDYFSRYYGGKLHFLVNDLLMAVSPLAPVFLPVNKHGSQSRLAIEAIDSALAGPDPVIIFPAGLVSRSSGKGEVCDLEWKKMFVNKAIASRRDIVPVHFSGANSPGFYSLARWRKRLGVKFNVEMLFLPREVFRSRGKRFTVTCGSPIAWSSLAGGAGAQAQADRIKQTVYSLNKSNPNQHTHQKA